MQLALHKILQARCMNRGIFNSTGFSPAGSKFPVVNNLLVAIKRKKNKDAIVLSAVCAICSALVLIYWMAK